MAEEEEAQGEAVMPRKRDSFMGRLRMGKLDRSKPSKGEDLYGRATLQGKERGLAKSKDMMGPLTKRGENLWGDNE